MAIHQRSSSRGSLSPVSPTLSDASLPKTETEPTRTNTLVVASMPASFFEPVVLDALRSHFESYGEIHTWAPLKAFARALVIYYDEEAAELAKESCDSLFIDATDFRCVPFVTVLFRPMLTARAAPLSSSACTGLIPPRLSN